MLKKLTFCSSLFLAACGGGDDGGGGIPSAESFVDGSFQDARVAGAAYPNSVAQYAIGSYGRGCMEEYNYFETADGRIQVYGSTAFSETDFQVVATMINDRLDSALAKFDLDWKSFVAQRELLNIGGLSRVLSQYQSYLSDPDYYEDTGNMPSTSAEAAAVEIAETEDPYLEEKELWAAWTALSREEQIAFVRDIYLPWGQYDAQPEHDSVGEHDVFLAADKVQVCLNDQMSGGQFGEGTQVGINVPPNTSTYHPRVGEIFTHELVHFIQGNIANAGQNPYALMPRWFTEGQAVYMSGQSIASVDHHHNFHPVQIIGFHDEVDVLGDGGDPSIAYEHYGLAYKYVHESNGRDTIVQMMKALKTNTDAPQRAMSSGDPFAVDIEYDEGLAFTRAFDNYINDHTGTAITIEQYRTNYHDYMNAWK